MSKRLIIESVEPSAIKALLHLEQYLATISISKVDQCLLKIRASQINGCNYCIDLHTAHALEFGESQQRIELISDWRNNLDIFTTEEQLLLAITEEITLISQHGLSNELYHKAELTFGQQQIVQIIMVVVTINAWNRLVVSLEVREH